MKNFKNKKLILFDLDGVLIKSLKNMQMAWTITNKKFNLNISFKNYKKHIGKPFTNILNTLNRQFLHAASIRFTHPVSNKRLFFKSKLPNDLEKLLKNLRNT